jgi:hypothetical protein
LLAFLCSKDTPPRSLTRAYLERHLEAAMVRDGAACTTKTVQVESLAADSHLGFGCGEFAAAETIRPPSTNAARTSYLPTDFTTLPFSERPGQTLEWAELSINRWQGEYGAYHCSRCQTAGTCCAASYVPMSTTLRAIDRRWYRYLIIMFASPA